MALLDNPFGRRTWAAVPNNGGLRLPFQQKRSDFS
jgi:hypothetical protein